MPAAPAPPPTTAPPAGVNIIESGKPVAPPPKPTTAIQVSQMPTTPEPIPTKPGSARERMLQDLRSKAKPAPEPPAGETPPAETPKAGEQPKPAETPKPPEQTPKPTETPKVPETPEERKKANPWKLVDTYKNRVGELEKQVAEAKTSSLAEQERRTLTERAEKAETDLKASKDRLRFLDYRNSDDFKKKYEEPYMQAWQRAMGDLRELTVTDEAGNSRAITTDDISRVVGMGLQQAREYCDATFGPFANDVMAHRKEIKYLMDSYHSALQEAEKTNAAEWGKKQEEIQNQIKSTGEFITREWNAANQEFSSDPKAGRFIKPIDGDEEWNSRLQKGFAFVDQAMSQNPADLKHSPEERAKIVRRHAAMRNRAAAFGAVRWKLEQAESRISELEEELKKYKESVPSPTGGRQESTAPAAGSAREQVFAALRAKAK